MSDLLVEYNRLAQVSCNKTLFMGIYHEEQPVSYLMTSLSMDNMQPMFACAFSTSVPLLSGTVVQRSLDWFIIVMSATEGLFWII